MTMRKVSIMASASVSILVSIMIFIIAALSGCTADSPKKNEGGVIPASSEIERNVGYVSVAVEDPFSRGGSFLACGGSGRLDRITADGAVENIPLSTDTDVDLTQVLVGTGVTLVSGYAGTLLYSLNGRDFLPCEGIGKTDVLGIAAFKERYYACTSSGSVLESDDGISWKLNAKLSAEPLISINAGEEYMMAVTAETDIHISDDGIKWDSQNFNVVYDGLYDKYTFTKMERAGETLIILGYQKDYPDFPLVMYSDSGGELWMFYSLTEINKQPAQDFCPLAVNAVCVFSEELMAACNKGRLLALATCESCNLLMSASNPDFRSIAATDDKMLAVGDDFSFKLFNVGDLRPDKIPAEQALADFESGAVIIDLRNDDEYIQSHVKGCMHIIADVLESKLPGLVPDKDTELIFYCSDGAAAQKALETALLLGYRNVFNLGYLGNWPYETE